MGMFDRIDFEVDCPKCGELVKDFQSKDGPCVLKTLQPHEVDYFYSSCDNCKEWITYSEGALYRPEEFKDRTHEIFDAIDALIEDRALSSKGIELVIVKLSKLLKDREECTRAAAELIGRAILDAKSEPSFARQILPPN